jgi:hypothetical protein
MSDESPFERPGVSKGYPLDKGEKAAVEEAKRRLEREDTSTPSPPPSEEGSDGEG